jgi:putative DNA primase/helicase
LAIDAMLDTHGLQVLVLDNVSCLFPGMNEDKKQDWEPIAQWLIQLRHRGITVLVGHHAGKNGQQRGTSGRADALDTIIALTRAPDSRPEDGCHFHLRFEKARGVTGPAVAGLDVRLESQDGRLVLTSTDLEVTRTEQVKAMLYDEIPAKVIADELGIQLSYVYRMKKRLGL